MSDHTIFYSWQSDRPNNINRGFIESCLEKALKKISASETIYECPRLDQGAIGVPGSPDIAQTIFHKILKADVFVCDLTFVDDGLPESRRRFPNPNVMIELGYAIGKLGWSKIICVFNEAFGKVNLLPFDFGHRKAYLYELASGQETSDQRARLTSQLELAIRGILEAPTEDEEQKLEAFEEFFSRFITVLLRPVIWATEASRFRASSLGIIQNEFNQISRLFWELSKENPAIDRDMVPDIQEIAALCDSVGSFPQLRGRESLFHQLLDKAKQRAVELWDKYSHGRFPDHLLIGILRRCKIFKCPSCDNYGTAI